MAAPMKAITGKIYRVPEVLPYGACAVFVRLLSATINQSRSQENPGSRRTHCVIDVAGDSHRTDVELRYDRLFGF